MPDPQNALPKINHIKNVIVISAIYTVLGIALAIGVSSSENKGKCQGPIHGAQSCLNELHTP